MEKFPTVQVSHEAIGFGELPRPPDERLVPNSLAATHQALEPASQEKPTGLPPTPQ